MHVASAEPAVEQRASNGSGTEGNDLNRVSVLGSESKGSRVLVVDLVDVLVDTAVVHQSVREVVPGVLAAKGRWCK